MPSLALYLITWMVLGLGMVVGGIVGVVVAVCIGPIQLLPLSVCFIIIGAAILSDVSLDEKFQGGDRAGRRRKVERDF